MDQADAGLRFGGPGGCRGAPVADGIAGPHWREPADVVQPGRSEARGAADILIHHQAHRDAAGVPTARYQTLEEGVLRCPGIDVEGLRVELAREGDDFRLRE